MLEYRKRLFPGLYCLKKKLEKWFVLDQNHGLPPLEKCEFFDFLKRLVFLALKGVFSFQIIVKDIFLGYIELTALENCQFFECLNFLFL